MKITKSHLKQIIKEELQHVLSEAPKYKKDLRGGVTDMGFFKRLFRMRSKDADKLISAASKAIDVTVDQEFKASPDELSTMWDSLDHLRDQMSYAKYQLSDETQEKELQAHLTDVKTMMKSLEQRSEGLAKKASDAKAKKRLEWEEERERKAKREEEEKEYAASARRSMERQPRKEPSKVQYAQTREPYGHTSTHRYGSSTDPEVSRISNLEERKKRKNKKAQP